ncbi:ectoine/hydroxyectoine ABC transporter permease subunit EhuC [Hydrogenophaga sp.]|uniref:ectoine/hydroxyectoine ABC transporter permease subunit EhuC n=1 Tax=Hydrogenophaga sp. TaxID=1904254 RepID=UPI00351E2C90
MLPQRKCLIFEMLKSTPLLLITAIVAFAAGLHVASFTAAGELLPELLRGVRITVLVALGGSLLAMAMALLAGLAKLYAPRPLRWLAVAYIETFRGTSALVQLFWLFFVLPHFGITLSPMTVGIVALGLNVGAYGAEVVRGAIGSVAKGQWEAAQALNMTHTQALRRIVLPQAFVAMIPPWGNLLIELLKATSLVSLITLSDLTFKAQQVNQNTLRTVEVFSLVLLMYLALSVLITVGTRALERKLKT